MKLVFIEPDLELHPELVTEDGEALCRIWEAIADKFVMNESVDVESMEIVEKDDNQYYNFYYDDEGCTDCLLGNINDLCIETGVHLLVTIMDSYSFCPSPECHGEDGNIH